MLLSAEHLSINFGSRQLLDDVNFYLNEGDKVGVIGINGTGKSTFLKVLSGVTEPDGGTISRNPNVQISLLPQNPAMEEDATVLEQVFLHFHREDLLDVGKQVGEVDAPCRPLHVHVRQVAHPHALFPHLGLGRGGAVLLRQVSPLVGDVDALLHRSPPFAFATPSRARKSSTRAVISSGSFTLQRVVAML